MSVVLNQTLKFICFEKATNICKISTLLLSYVVPVKSKVEILQNFVASSEYMNFICYTQSFQTGHANSLTGIDCAFKRLESKNKGLVC